MPLLLKVGGGGGGVGPVPPFLRPYVDVLGTCMLPDLEFHDYDSSTCSFRYFSPFLVSRCMDACMYAPPLISILLHTLHEKLGGRIGH